ncbi:hypothetical protein FVE85_1221 [Porphyridium purpureum]|uniref:Uncharacterized protein n=1 Tax=Porphyridium purpureum TaxID=35688 RepID=A0A5J4YID6_PORPP|nr:hypothetical protein FVE85_1221 [Porphyridium purpureum]|eukprot:POR2434..scf268_49
MDDVFIAAVSLRATARLRDSQATEVGCVLGGRAMTTPLMIERCWARCAGLAVLGSLCWARCVGSLCGLAVRCVPSGSELQGTRTVAHEAAAHNKLVRSSGAVRGLQRAWANVGCCGARTFQGRKRWIAFLAAGLGDTFDGCAVRARYALCALWTSKLWQHLSFSRDMGSLCTVACVPLSAKL